MFGLLRLLYKISEKHVHSSEHTNLFVSFGFPFLGLQRRQFVMSHNYELMSKAKNASWVVAVKGKLGIDLCCHIVKTF